VTATRSEALPELATVGGFVPRLAADTWYGIGAPKVTLATIIDKLNREINSALVDPKVGFRLALSGTVLVEQNQCWTSRRTKRYLTAVPGPW
jgi:tripartite-type tricarboxylate transporter receptor subunit TctC